jgi:hypothetical protein
VSVNRVDPVVRALLREHIASHEQLQIVLFLCRHLERSWPADVIARELSLTLDVTHKALQALCAGPLVRTDGDRAGLFRYAPATGSLNRAVQALGRAYETQLLDIMGLMNSNALERIRNASHRTFAEAFGRRNKDR